MKLSLGISIVQGGSSQTRYRLFASCCLASISAHLLPFFSMVQEPDGTSFSASLLSNLLEFLLQTLSQSNILPSKLVILDLCFGASFLFCKYHLVQNTFIPPLIEPPRKDAWLYFSIFFLQYQTSRCSLGSHDCDVIL